MFGYIYKTVNTVNGKIYIGQHKSEIFESKYKGSGKMLKSAFKTYGKDMFVVSIITWCENQEEMDEKERYYIDLFKSYDNRIGYNISLGGQSRFFTNLKHTQDTRQKMSDRAKNRPHRPTTSGRVCYTNGDVNKLITENMIAEYESMGWYKGKTMKTPVVPWNKGLTKETDHRVLKYTSTRNKHFENGESIGFCGVKGNTNGFHKGNVPWNKGTHINTKTYKSQ